MDEAPKHLTPTLDVLDSPALDPSRRRFMQGVMVGGVGLTVGRLVLREESADGATALVESPTTAPDPSLQRVALNINGADEALDIEPRVTLLDALREHLNFNGTKKGCDHGQCGACTVLIDGRRVNSCLTLAIAAEGSKITTIEGLANGDELHPMQTAFIKHDAFQCGYCTPGQICSAVGLLNEKTAKTEDDIREQMSGNICRCGAYVNIVAAVKEVGGIA